MKDLSFASYLSATIFGDESWEDLLGDMRDPNVRERRERIYLLHFVNWDQLYKRENK